MAYKHSESDTVVLASGASGNSKFVHCPGATRVHFSVSCDVTHQLTAGNVRLLMSDGKVVSITPAALPGGTDGTTVEVNAGGVVTGADLSSSTHRGIVVRSLAGSGTSGPYTMAVPLAGVRAVGLALTKAATANDATYTVICTVYD